MSDPFTLLGIPPTFDLDLESVEARHRELSRTLHPDRYSGRPASERRTALSRAIEVNEALRIVKDPVRRAEALLARRGVTLEEGEEPKASPELLMEMLELGEELAAAHKNGDLEKVTEIGEALEAKEGRVLAELSAAFATLDPMDPVSAPVETVERINRRLGELRYYQRVLGEARAIQDEIG